MISNSNNASTPKNTPAAAGTHRPAPSMFSPLKLARVVLRRWYVPLLFALAGGGVGVWMALNATPIYLARAEIEMSVQRPQYMQGSAVLEDGQSRDVDVIFKTRFAKFSSPAMEALATEEYFKKHSKAEYRQRPSKVGAEELAYWVQQVNWWKDGDANIVNVSFKSPDAEFAAQLVNVMVESAGMLMERENEELSDLAVKWLLEQAEEKRLDLDRVETKLADMRQKDQMGTFQQRRATLSAMIDTSSQEKGALETRLALRLTDQQYLSGWKESGKSLETLPSGLPQEERLNELITAYRTARERLDQVAERFTSVHPRYIEAAQVAERAEERLASFIEVSEKSVANEIALLREQIAQLGGRVKKMEGELLELDKTLAASSREVLKLERQRDAADMAYRSVLARTESARLAADQDTAFVKVLRGAEVPTVPVAPDKVKMVLAAVFIAVFLGAGLVIVFDLLFDRIASVGDLKEARLNMLGTIPRESNVASRADLATSSIHDNMGPMMEVFSGVNSILNSEPYAHLSKVILLTSAGASEGKTISASNLAICSARNGLKTLLIDADLRRPRVADIYSIDESRASFFEWLAAGGDEEGERQGLVSRDVIENLDLIASRPMKKVNPAEVLGRTRLKELIAWARGRYDRIIIDSPPLGPVGDGLVLAALADSILVVARVGKTRKRTLRIVLDRIAKINVPVVGCIANDIPHSLAGMFGGGEGYGYGHNYKSYVSGD